MRYAVVPSSSRLRYQVVDTESYYVCLDDLTYESALTISERLNDDQEV